MDKHLNFHRAVPADSGDFFLGQLPGQHHPGNSQGSSLVHPIQTVNGHLRGCMNGNTGGNLTAQSQDAQILDNEGVHLRPGRRPNELCRLGTLPVGN